MTTVLIADDEDLMRAGLIELLTADPGIQVVGEAATGREAVALARRLAPDVVLMDVRMPDLDGIAATRELVGTVPEAKVLILTTFEQDDYVFGALRAGASGSCSNGPGPRTSSPPSTRSPTATACSRLLSRGGSSIAWRSSPCRT